MSRSIGRLVGLVGILAFSLRDAAAWTAFAVLAVVAFTIMAVAPTGSSAYW
jgi:hypothetical protein